MNAGYAINALNVQPSINYIPNIQPSINYIPNIQPSVNYITNVQPTIGYIYIMHRIGTSSNVFKVGKTINQQTTKSGYERSGNVNMLWCPVKIEHMDNAEKIILNIFAPYRTKKTVSHHLLEEIKMSVDVLKIVIEWCVNNIDRFDMLALSRCASVNTITKHRDNLHPLMWTELCDKVISDTGINYPFPMLISEHDNDYYAYLLNQNDFDQCIKMIHTKHVTFAQNLNYYSR